MNATLVLFAAVLPAAVLLYFIYKKDFLRPEPKWEMVKAFFYGMASALVSLVFAFALYLFGLYDDEAVQLWDHVRVAFFGAAIPEEGAKLLMLWLFVRKCKHFDEWVDGIVYAVCVGMGFAAFENIEYLFTSLDEWLDVGTSRALTAVPAHFFFAVAMGYFLSKGWFGDPKSRDINYVLALLVPVLFHGVYDACLMVSDIAGISAAAVLLFIGLYIFMAVRSRKFYLAHHKRDLQEQEKPKIPSIDEDDLTGLS